MHDVKDSGDQSDVPAELRTLAESSNPEDRAQAGRRLAAQVGNVQVEELLVELVLDKSDTSVTYETAEALLERRDTAATRVIARACVVVDPRDLSVEWLGDAVNDVWLQEADDARIALALTASLSADPDEAVRDGAEKLRVRIESGDWPRPPQSRPSGGRWMSRLLRRLRKARPDVP